MFEMNGSMDSKELKFYVSPIKNSFFPLENFKQDILGLSGTSHLGSCSMTKR